MLVYLIFIFSIYFGFLLVCMFGWRKFVRQRNKSVGTKIEFASVIIAVRDEEHSITHLLDSLEAQDCQYSNFEILFVDDHSTDNTEQLILNWISKHPQVNCNYLKTDGNGKKQALSMGIQKAKANFILTTDADCILPPDWISAMVFSFSAQTSMVVGLVKIQQDN